MNYSADERENRSIAGDSVTRPKITVLPALWLVNAYRRFISPMMGPSLPVLPDLFGLYGGGVDAFWFVARRFACRAAHSPLPSVLRWRGGSGARKRCGPYPDKH